MVNMRDRCMNGESMGPSAAHVTPVHEPGAAAAAAAHQGRRTTAAGDRRT